MTEQALSIDDEGLDQDELRHWADMGTERLQRYNDAEMYYNGDQPTYLTDRAKAFLEQNGIPYTENFCETVVDALVERLEVVGFACDSQPVGDWLSVEWWDFNKGDLLQLRLHREAAKKGDAFLLLDWDDEHQMVSAVLNQPEIVRPWYDAQGNLTHVSKVWTDTYPGAEGKPAPMRRMNVYRPDRIEKYWTPTKEGSAEDRTVWLRWRDEGDVAWPLPWTGLDGRPLGIPVFHFANRARSDRLGRAEHWGTIPQQNRLNKELLDLAMVLDQQGFPQRTAVGLDDTSGLKNVPGEVWSTSNTEARFDQFEAASPDGLLRAVEATMMRIATRSNTPTHRFYNTGGWPSGEALKVAEAGLVAKCKDRATEWGAGGWANVARMVLQMQQAFGPGSMPSVEADTSISVMWDDFETRNEKEHLEALSLMSTLGVSKDTLLSMIPGIDPARERVKKAAEEREAARRAEAMMQSGMLPPAGPGGFGRQPQPTGANGSAPQRP